MSDYLTLLRDCLLGTIYQDPPLDPFYGDVRDAEGSPVVFGTIPNGVYVINAGVFNPRVRQLGRDWPMTAHTMIGQARMDNLRACIETVLSQQIPGDLIETGVWRGGACIFMRGILKQHYSTRRVFVADSFEGLPEPTRVEDSKDWHSKAAMLSVSIEEVKANFERYGLLDEQVVFLKGWFKDTLPTAPVEQLAILRLDGDMYESTMDGLVHLYGKVSEGGYVIVDDYYAVKGCQKAVNEFRELNRIDDPLTNIDGAGAYWRKSKRDA